MKLDELNRLLYNHCLKVLPTVYDDSLSYYEILCKLNRIMYDYISEQLKFNEQASKQFKELIDENNAIDGYIKQNIQKVVAEIMNSWKHDGSLESLIDSYFQKRLIGNRARTTLFAINRVPNTDWRELDYSVQGFCIMRTKALGEAEDYVVSVFRTGDNESQSIIVCRGLTTGNLKWQTTASVGHGNSCCWRHGTHDNNFGKIYVGVSASVNKNGVVAIDGNDGTVLTFYDLNGKSESPTAITYSEKLGMFIYRHAKNLYKADPTFTNIELITDSMLRDPNPFYQGIWCDDTFIYQNNGYWVNHAFDENNIRQQFIDIHFLDGTFYKRIKIDGFMECEEGDFTSDGTCIIQFNYRSQGWLYYCSIYEDVVTYESDRKNYLVEHWGREETRSIYVNEEYDGFFVDGSNSKPIPSMINIFDFIIDTITEIEFNLLSDITNNINFKKCSCNITIRGNNHKVNGMYFSGVNWVRVYDTIIRSSSRAEKSMLAVYRPLYISLNNVVFKNESDEKPTRNIHAVGQCTLYLTDVVFETGATQFNIDAVEGAFVYCKSLTDKTTQTSTYDCNYSIGNSSSVFEKEGVTKQLLYQTGGSEFVQILRPMTPQFGIDSNKIELGCVLHISTTYNHNFHTTLDNSESPISLITERIRTSYIRQQLITKKGEDYTTRERFYNGTTWSSWKKLAYQ